MWKLIQDDVPLRRLGIAGHQMLNVGERILFGARRSRGGDHDLSIDHIEIDEPAERAMANVLKLAPQDMVWLHGQVGMFAL